MRITLVLTHKCNLACSYCYAGEKFNRSMTYETGCKALHMAFAAAAPEETVIVSFFGGEPMLEFELMVRLARTARRMGDASGRPVQFMITTNATVLNERQLRFLYTYDFEVALSVDGLTDGNRHRPFATGKSSTAVVWDNVGQAAQVLDKLQVLMVVGPDTVADLPRSVGALFMLGVPRVSLLPNVDLVWSDAAWDEAGRIFTQLARNTAETKMKLHPFIDRLEPSAAAGRCGFGEEELAVSPAGKLYPCARLVGTDTRRDVQVGNVCSGIDRAQLQTVQGESRRRLSACGVDGPCGCVPLMPGGKMERQLVNYKQFGACIDQAVANAVQVGARP